ncbi:DUF1643 domain-containing protein (plasmid) [Apilactobacillus apisilvae]|uniref:DUF1643 domain-containing protein n=1 Tax=Apilactobacillus apisilvae TaxID=2923364 RepID=A0ABY4PJ29_9LACO|nr:DUF1643 domain-containing protein [Apilactobacillus apisilvae]UQS85835.1 DUF1643 domain-containing protein [Apilactobacillus apisilvae]
MSIEQYDNYKVNKVSSDERFNLIIKLNQSGTKKARVLMMNPSYANTVLSDPTTNLVINKLKSEEPEYKEVEILNVSPKITPQPFELLMLDNEEEQYNIHYLCKKMTDKNYDLFFATGNIIQNSPNDVQDQMRNMYQAVLKKLEPIQEQYNIYTYGLTEIYGKHISRDTGNLSSSKTPVSIDHDDNKYKDKYYLTK